MLLLDLHFWYLIRSGCAGIGVDASLFPHSVHGAGSIGMLDDGFDSWDWLSALLWDVAALPGFTLSSSLELPAWFQYPSYLVGFNL